MNRIPPRQIMICVDFGMTGSAVAWRTEKETTWESIKKIPTVLAYDPLDNGGPPIAWGRGCVNMGADEVKQCFKAFFGSPEIVNSAETILWAPTSRDDLYRWIRDYLRAFCHYAAETIRIESNMGSWPEDVVWNFSVPGRWSTFPVVANFKQLAEEALGSFPIGQTTRRSRVEVLATEAEASAQCILSHGQLGVGSERYAAGNLVISCDIGGATTDVAISEIVGPGKLASCSKLTLEPRGIVAFEQRFWEHTKEVLRSAGALEPRKWALQITKSIDLVEVRNNFSKSYGDVAIQLPRECDIEAWKPSSTSGPGRDTTIQEYKLCIPSVVFERFLTDLVEEVEEAIDEAINVLKSEFKNVPAVIGLCGGGSQMHYLQAILKARYEPFVLVVGPGALQFSPDLATSRGLGLIYDQRELFNFASDVIVGIETGQGAMEWITGEAHEMLNSGFKKNSWVFTFTGKSREKTVKHKVVTIPTVSPAPRGFRDAYRTLHSRSWAIEVDLRYNERLLPKSVKYNIVCSMSRPNELVFQARLKSDGQQLSCHSRRV